MKRNAELFKQWANREHKTTIDKRRSTSVACGQVCSHAQKGVLMSIWSLCGSQQQSVGKGAREGWDTSLQWRGWDGKSLESERSVYMSQEPYKTWFLPFSSEPATLSYYQKNVSALVSVHFPSSSFCIILTVFGTSLEHDCKYSLIIEINNESYSFL